MASLAQSKSKRKYSWWWDSHISPKNSKWLQENLTDMDAKVKQMIKLIEEDADSFARRAEMYYEKRPELMKLVEEFYRAYRALAERYDHATSILRQAHKTMAEAFANQEPVMLVYDLPSAPEADPQTPGFSPVRPRFDPDELQKDASGTSSPSNSTRKNVVFAGLRRFDDLFGSEGRTRKSLDFEDAESPDSSVKNDGGHDRNVEISNESELLSKAEQEISTLNNVLARLEAEKEAAHLQYQQTSEKLSCLESEVSRAKGDSTGLEEQARKARDEVQTLKEVITKLEAEREAGVLQCQQYVEKITDLENSISQARRDGAELGEHASKAEAKVNSLKEDLDRFEIEKEYDLVQHKQCLEKRADMEGKFLHAEEDARRSNERAGKAEREVDVLKQKLAELTEEKEAAEIQYLQCLETITNLEQKLDSAHEETKRLNSEIDAEVARFKEAEERCLVLESKNRSMHSELEFLAQKMAAQSDELAEKQHKLGRLWTCLQEERLRFVEAETAFQTLQQLHIQSQGELKSLAAEFQNRTRMLENEVERVKAENKGLNEVTLSSSLSLQNLQEEILLLRDTIGKLEADVELRVDQRNALQQEIYCLKEELNELDEKNLGFVKQVKSVGLGTESFIPHFRNLQDENLQLKEDCEKERGQKLALMEKQSVMDKLVEKNAVLENSLSDLNVELECVRDKVEALEESCQYLLAEKSTLADEKSSLVSQLMIASENLQKTTEKNNSLEESLLEANSELQVLQEKSKTLEDACLLLGNEKSDLVTARESLGSLNGRCRELEEKHFSLEKERESMPHEANWLKVALDAEKQEHASLAKWSESQLAGMKLQLSELQKQLQCKSNECEAELESHVNSSIEILVLQESIRDLKEKNFALLLECQQLLETSELSKKLISKLEHENVEHKSEANSLLDRIKVLRTGLYNVFKTLDENERSDYNVEEDKTLFSSVLNKLQETQMYLFELEDSNQMLIMEISLLVTWNRQLQLETKLMLGRLNNQLQNRTDEVKTWESQAEALFSELHVSTVQAALFEGKVHDLAERCENLEESNNSRAMEIDLLKEIATTSEAENEELKACMSTYVKAFVSLKDSVIDLEKCTVPSGTLHEANGKEAKDLPVNDIKSDKKTTEVRSAMPKSAPLDLKELQMRIKAIENSLVKKEKHLVPENSGAYSKLEAAMKHIEELKSEINFLKGAGMGKPAATYPNDEGLLPGTGKNTNEISEEGTEVIPKDIILDQISNRSSFGIGRRETLDSDDPMLEMWEAANRDESIDSYVRKTTNVNKTRYHLSTESLGENKFAIDKLEISTKLSDSQQDGNKGKILERLDSDAQKLTNLDIRVQDKRKVEYGEKRKRGKGIEYDSVKELLEESEEVITKLFNVNRELEKAFEDSCTSFDEKSALARKGSEKIGRVQLEVQKLQFLLTKLDNENKTEGNIKAAEKKKIVLLQDYLYGRTRAGSRQKKGHLCSCM